MTRIRRLRLILPPRFAGIAPHAAREIAQRLVDTTHDAGAETLAALSAPVTLTDHGQSAAQIGVQAGQSVLNSQRGRHRE